MGLLAYSRMAKAMAKSRTATNAGQSQRAAPRSRSRLTPVRSEEGCNAF
jgi:hypothetical protein